jgi:hypothetical protein
MHALQIGIEELFHLKKALMKGPDTALCLWCAYYDRQDWCFKWNHKLEQTPADMASCMMFKGVQ